MLDVGLVGWDVVDMPPGMLLLKAYPLEMICTFRIGRHRSSGNHVPSGPRQCRFGAVQNIRLEFGCRHGSVLLFHHITRPGDATSIWDN